MWSLGFAGRQSDISLTRLHRAGDCSTAATRRRGEVSRWHLLVSSLQFHLIIGQSESEVSRAEKYLHPKKFKVSAKNLRWSVRKADVCQATRRIFWKYFIHFVIDEPGPDPIIFYANTNHQDRKLYRIFTLFITISDKHQNERIFSTTSKLFENIIYHLGSARNWDLCSF